MNSWILSKIIGYLATKEGCEVQLGLTKNETTALITDAFGFRYEVQVKVLNRNGDGPNSTETYANTQSNNFMAVSKV